MVAYVGSCILIYILNNKYCSVVDDDARVGLDPVEVANDSSKATGVPCLAAGGRAERDDASGGSATSVNVVQWATGISLF